jgi:nitrate reductase gamma subunit
MADKHVRSQSRKEYSMQENAITSVEDLPNESWKIQTLVIGGVLGMLVGLGGAYLLTKRAEQKGTQLSITPGKGVQLGVLMAGLLRSILSLGED